MNRNLLKNLVIGLLFLAAALFPLYAGAYPQSIMKTDRDSSRSVLPGFSGWVRMRPYCLSSICRFTDLSVF